MCRGVVSVERGLSKMRLGRFPPRQTVLLGVASLYCPVPRSCSKRGFPLDPFSDEFLSLKGLYSGWPHYKYGQAAEFG